MIESLIAYGAEVEITSSGAALHYLKERFPRLRFHELPDEAIFYSKRGAEWSLIKRAVRQSKINAAQQRFIRSLTERENYSHLVSDNIYGAYSTEIPSAIITHQLSLKVPFGKSTVNAKMAEWINRFDEVWIPDDASKSIAGTLAENTKVSIPINHLGVLTRFAGSEPKEKAYEVGIVLGGPEPQRSILEKRILEMTKSIKGKQILFRGSAKPDTSATNQMEAYSMGDGREMAEKLAACKLVIGRSGYSTICDLLAIGAKALLIPTPGQTEQEYLAARVIAFPQFAVCKQSALSEEVIKRVLNSEVGKHESPNFFSSENPVIGRFLTK